MDNLDFPNSHFNDEEFDPKKIVEEMVERAREKSLREQEARLKSIYQQSEQQTYHTASEPAPTQAQPEKKSSRRELMVGNKTAKQASEDFYKEYGNVVRFTAKKSEIDAAKERTHHRSNALKFFILGVAASCTFAIGARAIDKAERSPVDTSAIYCMAENPEDLEEARVSEGNALQLADSIEDFNAIYGSHARLSDEQIMELAEQCRDVCEPILKEKAADLYNEQIDDLFNETPDDDNSAYQRYIDKPLEENQYASISDQLVVSTYDHDIGASGIYYRPSSTETGYVFRNESPILLTDDKAYTYYATFCTKLDAGNVTMHDIKKLYSLTADASIREVEMDKNNTREFSLDDRVVSKSEAKDYAEAHKSETEVIDLDFLANPDRTKQNNTNEPER